MSCSYATPGSRKKQSAPSLSSNSPDGMQNRIDRLEGLVLSLMTNGAQAPGPTAASRALSMNSNSNSSSGHYSYPQDVDVDVDGEEEDGMVRGPGSEESETDQVAQSLGVMKVDNNKSMYYADSHWAAILSDIKEVKNYFSEQSNQQRFQDQMRQVQEAKNRVDAAPQGPTFLFGGSQPPPYSELLARMPKRSVTDKLVSRYFNSYDPAVHILHPPSWYRAYERHWADPQKSGPIWLGQMFAVLCLAMHSFYRMDDEPPEFAGKSLALASNYRTLTGQCLLLADFTKPVNDMIETMVLHLHCEYARNCDAEVGVWVLVGMIVRLAMRMGYHRDPKNYPNITPFQGELRRRVWTFARQADLLFSFQIGLPSMIRLGDCDTELPRNLFDDEFDEGTEILPPSRHPSEPTPVSYMRAKASVAFAFGKVVERLHNLATVSYEEIMDLDGDLRGVRAELPPHLRLRTLDDSATDPGALIMQRFNLSILYHKGQCVLHRKFLARARENNRYTHSRKTCVDSSMTLLDHQATLHYESRPGHRLHGMKVFVSSLTAADFLLAAMIVALDLCYGAETETGGQSSGDMYTWGLERRSDMIRQIETSHEIWKETKDQSIESFKACELLAVILRKLKSGRVPTNGVPSRNPFPFPSIANGAEGQAFGAPVEEKPEHSAAMTLGMLSSGGITPNSTALFQGFPGVANPSMNDMPPSGLTPGYSMEEAANAIPLAPSPLSFFGNVIGNDAPPTNFDWVRQNIPCCSYANLNLQEAWDSYIQNAPVDTGNQAWSTSMDPALTTPAADGQTQMGQAPQANMFGNGAAFMRVNTPPGNMPL